MFTQESNVNEEYHLKSGGKIKYDALGKHYTWKRPKESNLKTIVEILIIIGGCIVLFNLAF